MLAHHGVVEFIQVCTAFRERQTGAWTVAFKLDRRQ